MTRPLAGRRPWARPLSTLGLLLTTLAAAGQALAGPASGLPWPSGAKSNLSCLAQLRGRAIDVTHVDVAPPSFAEMVRSSAGWVRLAAAQAPTALLSFALLPARNKGQFAQCAHGAFDGYWRQIGANLARIGGHRIIVEPGWEANIGSHSHPWGVDDAAQLPAYKDCFRRAAAALRSAFPAVTIAWTNAKMYRKNYTVAQMDPGTQDAYGLMYYDNYTPLQSQATWDRYVNSHDGTGGSPSGLGSWLAYARAHGKKLGVSEWGIWDRPEWGTATADDPVYIDNMYRFFRANAASIGWETYQNNTTSATDGHQLCPTTPFPRARAMYAQRWRAG
jgi:hypothetical protein